MKRYPTAVAWVLLVFALALADPPPFGTVIEQWNLHLPGSYAGPGMTWCRDEGRFYLMDQGYSGSFRAWKLDPADPPGTIESVPCTFANLGTGAEDIPLCFAWDNDSGCFWVCQIVDGNVYGGCYLLRHVWNGSRWVWGGTPKDSWLVGHYEGGGGLRCLWLFGFDKWHGGNYFIGATITTFPGPDTLGLPLFCPYAKTELGRIRLETARIVRGCALVPWDSAYILAWAWRDTLGLCKYDTTGRLLQSAPGFESVADLSLMWPLSVNPDDTVCAFCINANSADTLQRISLGMLWSQLGSVGMGGVQPAAQSRQLPATICRGMLTYQPTANSSQLTAEMLDIAGRLVMVLKPGDNDIRHLAPGVYYVRVKASDLLAGRKLVKLQ